MATIAERRAALVQARDSGALRVSYPDGGAVEYRSVAEIERALAALDAEEATASGVTSSRQVRAYTSKGL